MKFKWLSLFLMGVLLVIFFQGGVNFTSIQAQTPTLEDINLCLPPPNSLTKIQLLGTAAEGRKNYYLVQIIKREEGVFEEEIETIKQYFIISLDEIGCSIEVPDTVSNLQSWTIFVPLQVARQLALVNLKHEVEKAGGVKIFEERYTEIPLDGYSSPPTLFPEDIWAHQQLGITLPTDYLTIMNVKEIPVVDIEPMPGHEIPMEFMEYERYGY